MMARVAFIKWLSVAAIFLHLFSCQVMEEVDGTIRNEEVALKIKTRSSDAAPVPYPLSLYAFDGQGKCCASQKVVSENDRIELVLPVGTFKIVAVAGCSDEYILPEDPTMDEVIAMDGVADVPLMMGEESVEIDGEGDVAMEITLSYVVAGVNVSLKNIPSDVSAVSFSLSPLYSSISFTGEYGGASMKAGGSCFLSEGDVWKSDTMYVFPGSATETLLTIVLENKDGARNKYEYIYSGRPEAGRFFNLNGSYCDGITVTGSVIGGTWNGSDELTFDFGMFGQPDNGNDGSNPIQLPEIGTIWNGAIVADVIEDSTGAEILLLSLEEWDATTSQVGDITEGYSVNGITGWRLPSHEEAQMFRNRFCGEVRLALNALIAEYDEDLYGLDGEERYLCDKAGEFYSFVFSAGKSISQAGTQRSYYVRLVKTYLL